MVLYLTLSILMDKRALNQLLTGQFLALSTRVLLVPELATPESSHGLGKSEPPEDDIP
jgi:hypothetical protein